MRRTSRASEPPSKGAPAESLLLHIRTRQISEDGGNERRAARLLLATRGENHAATPADRQQMLGNVHYSGLAISRAARAAVSARGSAETNGGSLPHESPCIYTCIDSTVLRRSLLRTRVLVNHCSRILATRLSDYGIAKPSFRILTT